MTSRDSVLHDKEERASPLDGPTVNMWGIIHESARARDMGRPARFSDSRRPEPPPTMGYTLTKRGAPTHVA